MAARRLWLAFAIELCVYALLIALVQWRAPLSPAALVGLILLGIPAAMLAVRVGLVLASFLIAIGAQPRRPSLGVVGWLDMFAREVAGLLRFERLIMTGPYVAARHSTSTAMSYDKPLLILLHGIYCSGAVWRPLLQELEARTHCEIRTPSLEPVSVRLEEQVACFARWLAGNTRPNDPRRVIVVAHSMGGLVARLYLLEYPDQTRIDRMIFLATPHRGSLAARLLRSAIARDLCLGSAPLATLAAAPSLDPDHVLNVYTEHDNLVVPAENALLPSVRNARLVGHGHISLIYSRAVMEIVVGEVTANET